MHLEERPERSSPLLNGGRFVAALLEGKSPAVEIPDSLTIGFSCDDGRPVTLSDETMVRHGMIVGASGSGKTSLALYMIHQQIRRGGGLLVIDAKSDLDLAKEIAWLSWIHGRESDVLFLTPAIPEISNTWNFVGYGDVQERVSKLIQLIPHTQGGEYYRETQHSVLAGIIEGLCAVGKRFHIGDVVACLTVPKSLESLIRMVYKHGKLDEAITLLTSIESFRANRSQINWGDYLYHVSGIGRILYRYMVGGYGNITVSHDSDINLLDAVLNNKIIYIQLPIMKESESAWDWAKVVMLDMMGVAGTINVRNLKGEIKIPFLVLADEFGAYATPAMRMIFEQARSARISMWALFQATAQLLRDPKAGDLLTTISSNTATKVHLQLGSIRSVKEGAEELGKARRLVVRSGGTSSSQDGRRGSSSFSLNVALEEDYFVPYEELMSLNVGEAWARIQHAGRPPEVVKIRWPYLPKWTNRELRDRIFDAILEFRQSTRARRDVYNPAKDVGLWEQYAKEVRQNMHNWIERVFRE